MIFCKLKQNRKSDDDDAVHKLCSQRYKVQTVKLTLQSYKYKSCPVCEISGFQAVVRKSAD